MKSGQMIKKFTTLPYQIGQGINRLRRVLDKDRRKQTKQTKTKKVRLTPKTTMLDGIRFNGQNKGDILALNRRLDTMYQEVIESAGILEIRTAHYFNNFRGCRYSFTPIKIGDILIIKNKRIYIKRG